ncbi:MAG: hypothetical protein WCP68_18505, partial [Enhydrobacter sp.]
MTDTEISHNNAPSGIDDPADGLPSIEGALSLLHNFSREVSEAEGEAVGLQPALRWIAENNPGCLFRPPILTALAKLKLDSRPDWNNIKGMLGRTLPPGLAATVSDKCTAVRRARRRRADRAAMSSASHRLGDTTWIVEPGPEIDAIVEALRIDPDAALKAVAIDVLLDLQRRIDAALDAIEEARESVRRARRGTVLYARMQMANIGEDLSEEAAKALDEELDSREKDLHGVLHDVRARLREGGARIGRVQFRVALGRFHDDGAAIVARIERQEPLRHDERLALRYDPVHLHENVDFVAETAALHPELFWADRYVVINHNNDGAPSMLPLDARTFIARVAGHIDFVSVDERTLTLPDK